MTSRLNQHLLCGSPRFLVLFVSFSVVVSVYLIAYLPWRAGAILSTTHKHTVPVTVHSRHPPLKSPGGLTRRSSTRQQTAKGKTQIYLV